MEAMLQPYDNDMGTVTAQPLFPKRKPISATPMPYIGGDPYSLPMQPQPLFPRRNIAPPPFMTIPRTQPNMRSGLRPYNPFPSRNPFMRRPMPYNPYGQSIAGPAPISRRGMNNDAFRRADVDRRLSDLINIITNFLIQYQVMMYR